MGKTSLQFPLHPKYAINNTKIIANDYSREAKGTSSRRTKGPVDLPPVPRGVPERKRNIIYKCIFYINACTECTPHNQPQMNAHNSVLLDLQTSLFTRRRVLEKKRRKAFIQKNVVVLVISEVPSPTSVPFKSYYLKADCKSDPLGWEIHSPLGCR